MKICGIDPGIRGAMALVIDVHEFVGVFDLPTMPRGTSQASKSKSEINGAALADVLESWKPDQVVIEQAQPMGIKVQGRRQGVASTAYYLEAYGVIKGVCAALRLPVLIVTAQRWKRAAGLRQADKDASRTLATRLYPAASRELARKRDEHRAEALLIARFAGWPGSPNYPENEALELHA